MKMGGVGTDLREVRPKTITKGNIILSYVKKEGLPILEDDIYFSYVEKDGQLILEDNIGNYETIDALVDRIIDKHGKEDGSLDVSTPRLFKDENIGFLTDSLLYGYKDLYDNNEINLIRYGVANAVKRHGTKQRICGHGYYFSHAFFVSRLLLETLNKKVEPSILFAGLAHDVPEDAVDKEMENLFEERSLEDKYNTLPKDQMIRLKEEAENLRRRFLNEINGNVREFLRSYIKESRIYNEVSENIYRALKIVTRQKYTSIIKHFLYYFTNDEKSLIAALGIKNMDGVHNIRNMQGVKEGESFSEERQLKKLAEKLYMLGLQKIFFDIPTDIYNIIQEKIESGELKDISDEKLEKIEETLTNPGIGQRAYSEIGPTYDALLNSTIEELVRLESEIYHSLKLESKYGPLEIFLKKPFYKMAIRIYDKIGGLSQVTEEGETKIKFKEHPLSYPIVKYFFPIGVPFSHLDGTLRRHALAMYHFQSKEELEWPLKQLEKDVLAFIKVASNLKDGQGYMPFFWIGKEEAQETLNNIENNNRHYPIVKSMFL